MIKEINKKQKIVLSVLLACATIVGAFFLGFFVRSKSLPSELEAMNYILSMYKKYYYEEESSDVIVDTFASSLLDQYSDYYSKEDLELMHTANKGGREGMGISYNSSTNEITGVSWNSPSDRAGIKPGGKIRAFKYDTDEFVTIVSPSEGGDKALGDIIEFIPDNEEFQFLIEYEGALKEFTVMRAGYTETFVRYYTSENEYGFREVDGDMQFVLIGENKTYDLKGRSDLAVIDYNGFAALNNGLYGSVGQMERALSQFKEDGKTNLILDLRNNGGGFMDILQEVSAHFIGAENNTKNLVSVAKYKNDKEEEYYSAKVDYHDFSFESITVLANSGTASASEVLIGAMLDYDFKNIVKVVIEGYSYKYANFDEDRIEIVTEYRTYGKGIMQTTYENPITQQAIKLTTAKIFWPITDISIHGRGVTTALNEELNYSVQKIYNVSDNGAVYDAVELSK